MYYLCKVAALSFATVGGAFMLDNLEKWVVELQLRISKDRFVLNQVMSCKIKSYMPTFRAFLNNLQLCKVGNVSLLHIPHACATGTFITL